MYRSLVQNAVKPKPKATYEETILDPYPTKGTWAEQKKWHQKLAFMHDLKSVTKYAIGANAYNANRSVAKQIKKQIEKI